MQSVVYLNGERVFVRDTVSEIMAEKERADTQARVGARWGMHGRNDRWMRLRLHDGSTVDSMLLVIDPAKFDGCSGELQ